jgi:uncharacterized protein YxjI
VEDRRPPHRITAPDMNYVLKQKLLSVGNNFTIKNVEGHDAYLVKGEILTIRDKLSFQDLDGNELIYIEQRFFNSYDLWRDGKRFAEVKRDFFRFLRRRFTITLSDGDDLEAVGDLLNVEYVVTRGDRQIATLTRQWFRLSDTYFIQIDDDEPDPVLVLAIALVIEVVTQRRHNW